MYYALFKALKLLALLVVSRNGSGAKSSIRSRNNTLINYNYIFKIMIIVRSRGSLLCDMLIVHRFIAQAKLEAFNDRDVPAYV